MVVGTRRAGLSISETADLLGFSHTIISNHFTENGQKNLSSEQQLSGRKCLDARGQRRMTRLVRADRQTIEDWKKKTLFCNIVVQ